MKCHDCAYGVGPVGTPRRDRLDRMVERILWRDRIAHAVTRHWPEYMRIFWTTFFVEGPSGAVDAMSFSYLGDFMFHGQPITQDYADSPLSRVHLPRWLKTLVKRWKGGTDGSQA